ncbi:MAG: hypothetical protein JEZ00_07195 [Anaerolineaceae bacterium]|nr:hypothetical protein [Anaerolineaceae bacterium]
MLLILELAFLGFGIYAIFTGKMSGFLFGGGKYKIEGTAVRLLGVLLILPFPIIFVSSFILMLFIGEDALLYASLIEISVVVGVAIIASIAIRFIRKPNIPEGNFSQVEIDKLEIESKISRKSTGALIYTITGAFGIVSIIVCPLAFLYATQAINLIKKHNVGEQHLKTAVYTRGLAIFFFVIYACIAAVFLWVVLGGGDKYLL